MEYVVSGIVFFLIFSALILIHEGGHFWAARFGKIKVEEFGFGLPPRAYGKKNKKSGVIYSLNWIPLGGFVRMLGEDEHEKSDHPNAFGNRPLWARIFTVIAGVLMNFLLGFILLAVAFMLGIKPILLNDQDIQKAEEAGYIAVHPIHVSIEEIKEGSPLAETGLQEGDLLLSYGMEAESSGIRVEEVDEDSRFARQGVLPGYVLTHIDGYAVNTKEELEERIAMGLRGRTFHFTLERRIIEDDGSVTIRPAKTINTVPDEEGYLGVVLGNTALLPRGDFFEFEDANELSHFMSTESDFYVQVQRGEERFLTHFFREGEVFDFVYAIPRNIELLELQKESFGDAIVLAGKETVRLSWYTVKMFGNVVTELVSKFTISDDVRGPVGIAQVVHNFVQFERVAELIKISAGISLSLAVMNIMPIPALDGGRLMFLLFELVTRRKPPAKAEAYIHAVGFILLLGLIALVTWNDIMRLFS